MALTKCAVADNAVGALGTTAAERALTDQQFKDKFDEMPEGIKTYLNDTLTVEVDAHIADTTNPHTVTATQVGLGNVANESKATMFTSPALTGTPTAPTAAGGTNTTQIATTAFVQTAVGGKKAAGYNAAASGTVDISSFGFATVTAVLLSINSTAGSPTTPLYVTAYSTTSFKYAVSVSSGIAGAFWMVIGT